MSQYGLTFNGTHSNSYDLIMRSNNRQLLPAYSKASVKIPGRIGQINADNSYDNRFLTIDFGFEYDTLEELQSKKRLLAKWLSGSGKLTFDDEPDKSYNGRIYSQIDFEQEYGVAGFTVVFEVDPLATGSTLQVAETITQSGQEIYIPYEGTYETSEVITIKNSGTAVINGFKLLIEQ